MGINTKSLRIGLVLDTSLDPTDGVQQYVVNVGEWLRAQGHEVHYLVGQSKERNIQNVHSLAKNITVRFNGNRTTIPLPTSKKKLRSFLQQNHFDILHVQVPHSPFMAQKLILAADKSTAVIGTFHILPYGFLSRYGNHGLGIWLKPSLSRFDKMLAVSPAAAKFALESFKIKSEVLPNVINFHEFNRAKPFEKYCDGKINVLFLGRLVPRKGCMTLLKAISDIKNSGNNLPAIRVIICGKGFLEKELKKYVNDNKLQDIIEFTGFVSEKNKPRFYASADVAVFPSSGGESFGIVLLEAMASGSAVVLAGDNPGYRSVMEQNSSLLFNPKDVESLSKKLVHFIRDSKARSEAAQWGTDYTSNFDINIVGIKLLEIYAQALRNRAAL